MNRLPWVLCQRTSGTITEWFVCTCLCVSAHIKYMTMLYYWTNLSVVLKMTTKLLILVKTAHSEVCMQFPK